MASSSTDVVDRDFNPSSSSGDSPHGVTSASGDSPLDATRRGRSSSSPEQYTRDVRSYWDSSQLDRDTSQWESKPDFDSLDSTTYLSEGAEAGDVGTSDHQSKLVHSTCPDLCLERRHKLKPQKDKTCLVCGDKALGYNFNAISCESCKAFFRRNAFKEIRGRCEGTCDVTVESRSYCKKCRLRKCFEVGMKRDLILNDTQKQVRRIKIQENRFRRQGMPVPVELHTQAATLAAASHTPSGTSDPAKSGAKPRRLPSPEPTLAEKLKEDPDAVTHTFTKQIELDELGLTEDARIKIQEILNAFQLSFDGPMERNPLATPTGTDFLNMADTSVRRLVKMAKQLSKFCSFSQEDQISLLKGAVVEVLVLRSAKMFDTGTRGWFVNKGGKQHMVSANSMLNNQDSQSFFQQYQRFATSLLHSTHHDNIVLMFMIVMTVMSPDRSSIKSTSEIAKAQEEYASLLKQYLHVRYPDDELMFARVLQKLADVRDLNETHTRMLMHMNIEDLEPLIVEIFDLSS